MVVYPGDRLKDWEPYWHAAIAYREQRDFGFQLGSNFLEAFKVGAVARVINPASLVFEDETTVATMFIADGARSPVLAH